MGNSIETHMGNSIDTCVLFIHRQVSQRPASRKPVGRTRRPDAVRHRLWADQGARHGHAARSGPGHLSLGRGRARRRAVRDQVSLFLFTYGQLV